MNGANQFTLVNPIALASLITNKMYKEIPGGVNLGYPCQSYFRTSFNGTFGNGIPRTILPPITSTNGIIT